MSTKSKHLAPRCRKLKLIAGTGCGKTKFTANLADDAAREILECCVGESNSTILERHQVFTTDENLRNKMIVAVRHNSNAISYSAIQETLTSAVARVIQKSRTAILDEETYAEAMQESLEAELAKKNNLKAPYSLLSDKGLEAFICGMTDWYRKSGLWRNNVTLYNTAKNLSQDQKSARDGSSLLSLIKAGVRDSLDQCAQKNDLEAIYTAANDDLSQRFFSTFSRDDCSADGYYYRDLDLQNPDKDFCRQIFTANNIQDGETLSIEVLCSEVVIYAPMALDVANMLRQDLVAEKVFSDPQNNLVFELLDTQGLHHADGNEDENLTYCSELVYKNIPDAILVVIPLFADPNGKKTRELYREVMQNYQKDTPIFLIHNKLDLFVNHFVTEQCKFNPRTKTFTRNANEITAEEINSAVHQRIEELDRDLLAVQRKSGKRLNLYSITCFFEALPQALSSDVQEWIYQSYDLVNSYRDILTTLAKNLERNAGKITFEIDSNEEQAPVVNDAQLRELLHTHLISPEVQKQVLVPGAKNLGENDGITPHGNSYHALGRRLRYGDGGTFQSDIDENYYYNCKNISITFPANIKNLLTPQFLHTLISQVLTLEGGKFRSDADAERFRKAVEMELCTDQYRNELIRGLLYYHAFVEASNSLDAFSFRRKFQKFLDNSRPLLTAAKLDEDAYARAIRTLVEEASRTVMNRQIIFA